MGECILPELWEVLSQEIHEDECKLICDHTFVENDVSALLEHKLLYVNLMNQINLGPSSCLIIHVMKLCWILLARNYLRHRCK